MCSDALMMIICIAIDTCTYASHFEFELSNVISFWQFV